MLVAGTIVVICIGMVLLWFREAMSSVDPKDVEPKIFVVEKGETIRSIASRLKKDGFIRDPIAFFIEVKKQGTEKAIQAGDFRLNPSMNAYEILSQLQHGMLDIWVTTLEGWRKEEVSLKLAQELSIPEQEFLKVANEGYLFPDTYLFPREATASAVVAIMKSNFDAKVNATVRQDISNQGLTFEQGLVLASIVEREGQSKVDRPVIAGILLKRMKEGWPLETDATIQYAQGYQADQKTWWKKNLLSDDKNIISPYNTYKNTGLPPEPICSPGLESILAVAHPQSSDYWFYLHDPKGEVHYGKTIEEHNQNIVKYLQ